LYRTNRTLMTKKGDKNAAEAKTALSKIRFLEALRANDGDISKSCIASKIGRQTFYDWKIKDQNFDDEVKEVEEEMLDFGESQLKILMRGIPELDEDGNRTGWKNKPDVTAIIFFLKTKGKKRGYIELIQKETKEVDEFSGMTDEQLKAELEKP